MENNKRPRGRPRVLTDEQRKHNKNRYNLTKEWYCDVCKTGRNYTMAGKYSHLYTKKHIKNYNEIQNLTQFNKRILV